MMSLPHRYDRAYRVIGATLYWRSGEGPGVRDTMAEFEANSTVLHIMDRDTRSEMEVIVIAACFVDEIDPHDAEGRLSHVYLECLIIENPADKHRRGPGMKMINRRIVDPSDGNLLGIRWAKQEEMDKLSETWYEKGGGSWMIPAEYGADPFAYFARLIEPVGDDNATLIYKEDIESKRIEMLIEQYIVYAEALVVEKEYPKFRNGRTSKRTRDAGETLLRGLCIAVQYIVRDIGPSQQGDTPTGASAVRAPGAEGRRAWAAAATAADSDGPRITHRAAGTRGGKLRAGQDRHGGRGRGGEPAAASGEDGRARSCRAARVSARHCDAGTGGARACSRAASRGEDAVCVALDGPWGPTADDGLT